MPLECGYKQRHGRQFCVTDCPASEPGAFFEYARVEREADLPAADPRTVDVAVLDMNHGWPNLGHDSIVHAVMDAACDVAAELRSSGLRVRAVSFDVRRSGMLPEPPGGRFSLYLGTGGPGHLDPHANDGERPEAQGVREDPSWEAPAFRLFDAVLRHEEAALVAVCHSFGVMCRWSGAAEAVLRDSTKGKSSGVLENVLTWDAVAHPWFRRFAELLGPGGRLRVVDNRLFDLIPRAGGLRAGARALGYETNGVGGPPGDAVTMIEFARDATGSMPRVFAVNHHPEIVDRYRQLMILNQKRDRGDVSEQWYRERLEILTRSAPDEDLDQRLRLTSDFTFLGPLRFHLLRALRRRAEALALPLGLHEDRVVQSALGEPVGTVRAGEVY
jgi:hypothetical protein